MTHGFDGHTQLRGDLTTIRTARDQIRNFQLTLGEIRKWGVRGVRADGGWLRLRK